eukprot:CAMPEP_0197023832 /NCGR_PEP_ID=MMETSP1384-20130603/4477_1 /TAXON_ID=29189 /ORGANISM="Ammonia sp." /LENGTH=315 /DNA_ID=CAMNT_0042452109 /DNA_START=83 /DNA_END=1030 /DNA_ORIENTATION=+
MLKGLLLLPLLSFKAYAQCPSTADEATCEAGTPADGLACCLLMEGFCSGGTVSDGCVDETPATTEEADCDNSDLNEWRVDYIGKSTQFRIYDPCDTKFIKIKMEDLTEYDGDTGIKTNRKETSFASAKDWYWGDDSGTVQEYQGNDAIYNKFVADDLTRADASFSLETRFFKQESEICCDDDGNNMTLSSNTLKFDVAVDGWDYDKTGNYLVLCIGVMTNKAGDVDEDDDTKTYYLDSFEISNTATAQCTDSNGDVSNITVTVERGGNGNNHLDLCYAFEACDGDISYDPFIWAAAPARQALVAFVIVSIFALFV